MLEFEYSTDSALAPLNVLSTTRPAATLFHFQTGAITTSATVRRFRMGTRSLSITLTGPAGLAALGPWRPYRPTAVHLLTTYRYSLSINSTTDTIYLRRTLQNTCPSRCPLRHTSIHHTLEPDCHKIYDVFSYRCRNSPNIHPNPPRSTSDHRRGNLARRISPFVDHDQCNRVRQTSALANHIVGHAAASIRYCRHLRHTAWSIRTTNPSRTKHRRSITGILRFYWQY